MMAAMDTPTARPSHSPLVLRHEAKRAGDLQLKVADSITAFAGSMAFVYVHIVAFVVWMLFLESSPWSKLTLIVSLEAIFLSTFVMIGQNRQASFQQAKADHDFFTQEHELSANTEITRAIHALAEQIHASVCERPAPGGTADASPSSGPATP
jgi:uncharacterized membrane protein